MNKGQVTIEYVEYEILSFLVKRKQQVTLKQVVSNIMGYKGSEIKSYLITLGMRDMIDVISGDGDIKYVLKLAGLVAWDDYPRSVHSDCKVRVSENVPTEGPKEGFTGVSGNIVDEGVSEPISSQQEDEFDTCDCCGSQFLARTSFDNFFCDQCYCSGACDGPDEEDLRAMQDDEAWEYCDGCNCPHHSCACNAELGY